MILDLERLIALQFYTKKSNILILVIYFPHYKRVFVEFLSYIQSK